MSGKTLVLGGAGFIGANLVRELVARGQCPRVFARGSRSLSNLRPVLSQVELVHGDFMDDSALRAAVQGVDTVYHLITTTFPNLRVDSSHFDLLTNLLPTLRLVDLAREAGVRRIVYASSGGTIYGEPQSLPITESHPLAPRSAYGQSKLTLENYLAFHARTSALEVTVLRLSNPYGPLQNLYGSQGVVAVAMGCARDGRPVPLIGDGSAVRDYIYIDDVVRAMLLAAQAPPMTVNISSGQGLSVLQVLAAVESASGRRLERQDLPARASDVRCNVLSHDLATARLSWRPEVAFEAGIAATWRALVEPN